ncbi:MAG: hypothetical protein IT531_23120 [Burkholderiales bacterium]|nr:hypothetical protein [Burkholderiales bacterium]
MCKPEAVAAGTLAAALAKGAFALTGRVEAALSAFVSATASDALMPVQ